MVRLGGYWLAVSIGVGTRCPGRIFSFSFKKLFGFMLATGWLEAGVLTLFAPMIYGLTFISFIPVRPFR